jgi:3-phosphoshikimate 1-carboxyvinyltransferase
MIDSLGIKPFRKECRGSVLVPGSKSISNRALILSVLCGGKTTLKGVLRSEDVDLMIEALVSLGVEVKELENETTLKIKGCGGLLPTKRNNIFVGNAGTIARFLTALLAAQEDGAYELDGTEAMRERPMSELLSFLECNGAKFVFQEKEGCFPFAMETKGLKGGMREIDATQSSQVLSAILMIAPFIEDNFQLSFEGGTVSVPFVDITLSMMKAFSGPHDFSASFSSNSVKVGCTGYRMDDFVFEVEPDATAASYFLTLPLSVGGACFLEGIHREMLQGDSAYVDVLQTIGIEIEEQNDGILAKSSKTPRGGEFDFNDISDTFLTLAAISPLLSSPLTISGIAHTRKQETDRVSAMATELRKLGQLVEETDDQLHIIPNLNKLRSVAVDGLKIETYRDHRFAMSFGILGSHDLLGNGASWLEINDPTCCSKTYPTFFEQLSETRELSDG